MIELKGLVLSDLFIALFESCLRCGLSDIKQQELKPTVNAVSFGRPQRSNLGPLLFLFFIDGFEMKL